MLFFVETLSNGPKNPANGDENGPRWVQPPGQTGAGSGREGSRPDGYEGILRYTRPATFRGEVMEMGGLNPRSPRKTPGLPKGLFLEKPAKRPDSIRGIYDVRFARRG
jgi:hypothetical protein